MKLRMQPERCILRLSSEDLSAMAAGALCLTEYIAFRPGLTFEYSLEVSEEESQINAICGTSCIRVAVPKALIDQWVMDQGAQELETTCESGLRIILQKDLDG